ncbi:MAG: hypothetical protein LKG23_05365 [Nitrospira sp.]|jgi:hypothetical protein|nr:hypothetical protein [Nitrospira sp.]
MGTIVADVQSSLTPAVAPSRRSPVAPHGLDVSLLVDLEHIDAFENDLLVVLAGDASREYGCRLVAGGEDLVCRQVDLFKCSEHRDQNLSQMKERESVEQAPDLAILQVHRMTVGGRVEQ